jgi:hypothetical protein
LGKYVTKQNSEKGLVLLSRFKSYYIANKQGAWVKNASYARLTEYNTNSEKKNTTNKNVISINKQAEPQEQKK